MPAHVLVYDHSATILANFQHTLVQAGFRVTARFPREIERSEVAKHAPDILVLALSQEAYRSAIERVLFVHDDPTLVQIPILLVVPDDQTIPVPTDIAGIHYARYRQKPFNIDQVIEAVEALYPPD